MKSRSLILAVALLAPLALPALAQNTTMQPAADAAKVNYLGEITGSNVYVRSGPSENYYQTTKLEKGARVMIVGIRGDWLKIVPPEGSFCYVSKSYVKQAGGTGRVDRPEVNIRAGSSLNDLSQTVLTKLTEGAAVTIIGEKNDYYMIKPPAGAFVYVNKQFVQPLRPLAANEVPDMGAPPKSAVPAPEDNKTAGANTGTGTKPPAVNPGSPLTVAPVNPQSPAAIAADADYARAEEDFAKLKDTKLEDQPLADLGTRYESLMNNPNLPGTLQRNSMVRYYWLKQQRERQQGLAAAGQIMTEAERRNQEYQQQQAELRAKIANSPAGGYAAIGQLQTSELSEGGSPLYRLVDPATGYSIIYIRTTDTSLASRVGSFVGVRGNVATEENQAAPYKYVTATSVESVDPNSNLTAQFLPPSMIKPPTTQPAN